MNNKNITIKILLVDDHAIVREGYRSLLHKQDGLEVIAEAKDGEEAYIAYKKYQPGLVIMDISLPKQSGIQTIARIKKLDPSAKILAFSMHQNPSFAIQATQAGALGYITKSSDPEVLIRGIYDVYQGKYSISADIAQALAAERLADTETTLDELTVREFEILRMLVEAKSTQDIADTLNISPKTVSNSHYIIKRKLNVSSDIELTHLAIKMNVINLLEITGPN
ncbi:MAG: response regulator transcription factor [Piscirickettsiaceae bacterium]|nr:response regulator transcription factor [Piscirickettsiaceae bacterium]